MNNELRVLPLREYRVEFIDVPDVVFTADSFSYCPDSRMYIFSRTGNVVRMITDIGIKQIVVSPVD